MDELQDWEAYYQLEPWGTPAEDDRWRLNYDLIFGAHYQAQDEPVVWLDRDPEETARRASRDAEDHMAAKFEAFLIGRGVVDANGDDDQTT